MEKTLKQIISSIKPLNIVGDTNVTMQFAAIYSRVVQGTDHTSSDTANENGQPAATQP